MSISTNNFDLGLYPAPGLCRNITVFFTFALGSCAILRVAHVIEARVTHQVAAVTGQQFAFYTLTYRTSPGDGVFQAMVKHVNASSSNNRSATVEVHGDILRLNSYSRNSGCVHHIIHKKWCHCTGSGDKRPYIVGKMHTDVGFLS